jgi:Phytanoyl-CoA dioxygenase (PhyH)
LDEIRAGESTVKSEKCRLESDGFVLLPRFLDAEAVAALLAVSRERMLAIRAALGTKEIGIGSAAGYDEIVQRSPGRWDVPITPQQFGVIDRDMPWWGLVASILGEDAEHSFSGVVSSDPGSPAQHWHTDSPHVSAEHLPAHAINVLVALHELPLAMGPTECARGSHLLSNHLSNPSLVLNELIYQHEGTLPETLLGNGATEVPEACAQSMAAGSCLIFDDRLLHRGLGNQSDSTRHVAYFAYRKKGYTENTHFESQRSLFDPGPPAT